MANHERSSERERRWRGVLARFTRSGLSVRAFCQQEQLPESAFYFWRRTLQDRDAEVARSVTPAFVPVAMPIREATSAAAELSIELRSGVMIRANSSVSIERIAMLVRALQAQEPST